MKKQIQTQNAPAAVGPYSQAVEAGNLLFVSGCIPLDPATGAMAPAEIKAQAARALENLQAVLAEAGCGVQDVVKTTVFLTDMGDFAAVNEVYASVFRGGVLPARSAVQVGALPKGAMVEVEAIACKG